jgi:hypothetical protein
MVHKNAAQLNGTIGIFISYLYAIKINLKPPFSILNDILQSLSLTTYRSTVYAPFLTYQQLHALHSIRNSCQKYDKGQTHSKHPTINRNIPLDITLLFDTFRSPQLQVSV